MVWFVWYGRVWYSSYDISYDMVAASDMKENGRRRHVIDR